MEGSRGRGKLSRVGILGKQSVLKDGLEKKGNFSTSG